MNQFEAVRVGVVGLGHISDVYLRMIERSPALTLVGIASTQPDRSRTVADRYHCPLFEPAALIEGEAAEIIVDLTPAAAHDAINRAIIDAGKHLYSEKPFALTTEHALRLAAAASERGIKAASAPDTFFGATHQKARALLDAGAIGTPVFGAGFFGRRGTEFMLPNPEAYYRPGGELPFDIGPYYVAQWINLLGPIRRVVATSGGTGAPRMIRIGPRAGQSFEVEVPTTYICILEFERVAVTLTLSLDVAKHQRRHMEIYGDEGMLGLADPDFFGGDIALATTDGESTISVEDQRLGRSNRLNRAGLPVADYRGIGLIDLAVAIRTDSEPRASLDLAVHIVEVLEAIHTSALQGQPVWITSDCHRPRPLGEAAQDRLLLELAASPFP